jgi:hypothetical protein
MTFENICHFKFLSPTYQLPYSTLVTAAGIKQQTNWSSFIRRLWHKKVLTSLITSRLIPKINMSSTYKHNITP